MGEELLVFAASGLVTIVAGFTVRALALREDVGVGLDMFDFAKDLFAAAAAVFPTTLIVAAQGDKEVTFSATQGLLMLLLFLVIVLWAKGEARYLTYWREGRRRLKKSDGKLGGVAQAKSPTLVKVLAFTVGNGLGFMILFICTAVSNQMAS